MEKDLLEALVSSYYCATHSAVEGPARKSEDSQTTIGQKEPSTQQQSPQMARAAEAQKLINPAIVIGNEIKRE